MSYTPAARVPVNIERLDAERQLRGWTWGDMALRAGVTFKTLWSVRKTRSATPKTFDLLLLALETYQPRQYAEVLRA